MCVRIFMMRKWRHSLIFHHFWPKFFHYMWIVDDRIDILATLELLRMLFKLRSVLSSSMQSLKCAVWMIGFKFIYVFDVFYLHRSLNRNYPNINLNFISKFSRERCDGRSAQTVAVPATRSPLQWLFQWLGYSSPVFRYNCHFIFWVLFHRSRTLRRQCDSSTIEHSSMKLIWHVSEVSLQFYISMQHTYGSIQFRAQLLGNYNNNFSTNNNK